MTTFLSDSFTEASDTTLASHNADTGGAGWTKHAASAGTMTVQGSSDRVRSDGSEGDYYHTATPGSANYYGQEDLVWVSTNNYAGVIVRMDTSATTWYGAGYDSGNTRWELFKAVAGSFTTLGTSSASFTSGTHTIKLDVSGTGATVSLTFYVDTVSTLTASDTDANRITATNKVGFYTASGAGNGYQVDNLSGVDGTGGASTTLPVRNRRPTYVWRRRVYA